MKNIENVIEAPKIFEYLEKRQLLEQYKKAKNFLKSGETQKILFKQRQPKSMNLFQFRINKKFRAF